MNQALLPEQREEWKIGQLTVGEHGYTVPWAMWVDNKRRLWLNPEYTLSTRKGGTVQMEVKKTQEGYEVDLRGCEYFSWSPKKESGYFGQAHKWIPVVRAENW